MTKEKTWKKDRKKTLRLGWRKRVFSENGAFVPCRKQVVLMKNGENEDLHSTHKNKGLCSADPLFL